MGINSHYKPFRVVVGSKTVVELSVQKLLHKFVSYVESPPLFFAAEALVYGMGMVCAAYSLSGRLNSNIKSEKVLVRNIYFFAQSQFPYPR